jgi:hypothetical protein
MWRRGGRLEGDGLVRLTRDFLGCDDAGIHKTKEIELNKNNISFNGREKNSDAVGWIRDESWEKSDLVVLV